VVVVVSVRNEDAVIRRGHSSFVPLRVSAAHPPVTTDNRNDASDDDDDDDDDEGEWDDDADEEDDELVCICCRSHINLDYCNAVVWVTRRMSRL